MPAIQHYETVAAEKAGNIQGWKVFYYERAIGGLIIKGGVPRIISKGPRKGEKTWDEKEAQTVLVSHHDAERAAEQYALRTGNCPVCFGEKKLLHGYSATEGDTYKPCKDCDGTGLFGPKKTEAA